MSFLDTLYARCRVWTNKRSGHALAFLGIIGVLNLIAPLEIVVFGPVALRTRQQLLAVALGMNTNGKRSNRTQPASQLLPSFSRKISQFCVFLHRTSTFSAVFACPT